MLDQSNGGGTKLDKEEWHLGAGSMTKRQKCYWDKMGLWKQT